MITMQRLSTLGIGVIAGLAGGLAEVVWVVTYAWFTGTDPTVVARGVTTAAGVSALLPASPAMLGVAVHMVLAAMLGIVLTFIWQPTTPSISGNPYPFMLAALLDVWGLNFFIVLPLVNPAFTTMLPYPVSLISKLLFALAAAEVVRRSVPSASLVAAGHRAL